MGTASAGAEGRRVPPLHVVTDDAILARADFASVAARLLEAGGPRLALHLRGPRSTGARMHRLAASLARVAARRGALLLVNDRVDVALSVGASGVHLGARSLAAEDARRLAGPSVTLGVSVHSRAEAEAALGGRPDFLLVGTLWATPSHPGRPGAGPALLAGMRDLGLPLIGIGGITAGRVREVAAAGGAGVAVMRGVWDAPEPVRAMLAMVEGWGSGE